MIEEDPDFESYYRMGNVNCHIPVNFHTSTPVAIGF